jgi:pimeloyl-ACP methyl ester carboxylesterase
MEDIDYKEEGRGPTLVLLHGFGGSAKQWDAVAMAMAKSYRVVVPDLSKMFLGAGLANFSQQVQILKNFLIKIDDGQGFHIAASSYGGALSWAVTIESPTLVRSLMLLCPMPPNPQSRFRSPYLRYVLKIGLWPALLWIYLKLPIGRIGLSRMAEIFQVPWLERKKLYRDNAAPTNRQIKVLTHVIHRFSKLIEKEDWSYWESRLSYIEKPVCLIWGERDRLYNSTEPSRFLRLFNRGQLHHIEDTGHFSMAENPLPVVYIMDHFLTQFKNAA